MFNPGGEPCENVHSHTRRMVMISPEPSFWIHVVSFALLFFFRSLMYVTSAWSCPKPLVNRSSPQAKARSRNPSSRSRFLTITRVWFTMSLSRRTCNVRMNCSRYLFLGCLVLELVLTDMFEGLDQTRVLHLGPRHVGSTSS